MLTRLRYTCTFSGKIDRKGLQRSLEAPWQMGRTLATPDALGWGGLGIAWILGATEGSTLTSTPVGHQLKPSTALNKRTKVPNFARRTLPSSNPDHLLLKLKSGGLSYSTAESSSSSNGPRSQPSRKHLGKP